MAYLPSVHARYFDIKQHQVGAVCKIVGEARFATHGCGDLIALLFQEELNQLGYVSIVLHDQDPSSLRRHSLLLLALPTHSMVLLFQFQQKRISYPQTLAWGSATPYTVIYSIGKAGRKRGNVRL